MSSTTLATADRRVVMGGAPPDRRGRHTLGVHAPGELPDGSRAELVNRCLDEDRAPEWLMAGDFDPNDPANRAAIESALTPAIQRLGPVAWPA